MSVVFIGQNKFAYPVFELTEPSPKRRPDYKFSYSELRDVVTCAHRYQLITIQKVQTVDSSIVRRLLVPNLLDEALTDWINVGFVGDLNEIAQNKFKSFTDNNFVSWKHPMDKFEQRLDLQESAIKLDKIMCDNGLCQKDAKTQFTVRVDMDLPSGKLLRLTGRLDLIYTDNLWIFDLKTTESQQWLDVKQLIYYDFAVSQMLGRKVKKCGFLVPKMNPGVQYLPNDGYVGKPEWESLFTAIDYGIARVHHRDFPDTGDVSKDCFMCFAKRFCKRNTGKGPQSVTQRGKNLKVGF